MDVDPKVIEKYYDLFNSINKNNILNSIDLKDMEKKILKSKKGTIFLSELKIKKGWFISSPLFKTIKYLEYLEEKKLHLGLTESKIIYFDRYLDRKYIYHFDYRKINVHLFNVLKVALAEYNSKLFLHITMVGSIVIFHKNLYDEDREGLILENK